MTTIHTTSRDIHLPDSLDTHWQQRNDMTEQPTETERATEYLAGFGLAAASIETLTEWQFLNDQGCWIDGNRNFPEVSARDNAAYFKTNRVRSREVTYTEWIEQ